MTTATAPDRPVVRPHGLGPKLRVGTRPSPLALTQTRGFMALLRQLCPVLRDFDAFSEHQIRTTGDAVQDRRLAEIGGKGLFAKEIHEALLDGRIDFAVHSLKDLETELPQGIALAATLRREDPRDALILHDPIPVDPTHPFAILARGARVGTASLRRQAQLLHARPDLIVEILRGNVQTRLDRLAAGVADATLLAMAGLRRLGLTPPGMVPLEPAVMVPAAGQGIIGITVRAVDTELTELLAALADPAATAEATAERAMLAALDGSCHTPIGAHARLTPDGTLTLTGLLARGDGTYLNRRSLSGRAVDAARLGATLGAALRAEAPADLRR